jgi:hypothetical protein
VKPTTSAHRALPMLGSVTLPSPVLHTRSSSGMSWDSATVPQLIAGARTSRVLRKSRLVPTTASATVVARPQYSSSGWEDVWISASEDYIICMAAALETSAVRNDGMSSMLATSMAAELAKQEETANLLASEAAKTQANAQKQAQINVLTIAIKCVTALLEHELLVLDFAGAIVIGLILIDLNNQLAALLQ